ncbi:MAG TPA: prephenate dehydrogenase/arogenate dehydrogenase family protein [Candidatus Acidoferrum sp.]|nr:prephenate dehydrogenase/arogenate dehydrogenase family protein [Candidatus Acidoferrum sp.]
MVNRIAVIGAGGMGAWFTRFFKSRGDLVSVADRDASKAKRLASKLRAEYAPSNVEAARRSDIVIIATPTRVTPKVIKEVLPALRDNALICEISATKSIVVPALRDAGKRRVKIASIHPMFGPLAHGISERKIVAIRTGKDMRGYKTMRHLLQGARFLLTDQDTHDKNVAVTLGLPHFLNMAFAMTLCKRRDSAEIRRFAGRTFNLQMLLAQAIADEPETIADIQITNEEFLRVMRDLQRDIRSLARIVNQRDRARLVARYKKIRRTLATERQFRIARRTFEKVTETQSAVSRR